MAWKFDAARIRLAREMKDFTQQDLAKTMGCTQQQVAAWENGNGLTSGTICRLAEALEVPPKIFFVSSGDFNHHQGEE